MNLELKEQIWEKLLNIFVNKCKIYEMWYQRDNGIILGKDHTLIHWSENYWPNVRSQYIHSYSFAALIKYYFTDLHSIR